MASPNKGLRVHHPTTDHIDSADAERLAKRDGVPVLPLPPEVREKALAQYTEEETIAALKEVQEKGGHELTEFVQELERVLDDHEPTQ